MTCIKQINAPKIAIDARKVNQNTMEEDNLSRIGEEEEEDEQLIGNNKTDENRPDEGNNEDEDEVSRKGIVGAYSMDDDDFLEASESEYVSTRKKKWEEGGEGEC